MEYDSIKEFLTKLSEGGKVDDTPRVIPTRRKYFGKRSTLFSIVALLFISAIFFGSYKVFKKFTDIRANDAINLISEVGKLTELPRGEIPTIATITNLEAIKNQIFFKEAKIGDKVLIFNISKKAILYRPSTKRIISIAPLYTPRF